MPLMILKSLTACCATHKVFREKISHEFALQPISKQLIVVEQEIKQLPVCVQKYLVYTGAVGKP
jgi:hypothetical protein